MVTWHSVGSFFASGYLESVKPAWTIANGNRFPYVFVRLWLLHDLLNFRRVWSAFEQARYDPSRAVHRVHDPVPRFSLQHIERAHGFWRRGLRDRSPRPRFA